MAYVVPQGGLCHLEVSYNIRNEKWDPAYDFFRKARDIASLSYRPALENVEGL